MEERERKQREEERRRKRKKPKLTLTEFRFTIRIRKTAVVQCLTSLVHEMFEKTPNLFNFPFSLLEISGLWLTGKPQ